jgi:hypothetical protein
MTKGSHWWKEWLRRYRHLIPMLFILLVLTIPELENAWTWDPCALQEMDHDIFTTLVYRPLARWALHFKPSPDPSVVIVYIDPATAPPELLTNTCLARVFLAKLVDDVSSLGAKAIVIDKYYSDSSCTDEIKNNIFKTAMTNKTVPIVVGQPTHRLTNKKGTDNGCLALSNRFDFGGQKVRYGLTRLNSDVLKLPLRWPVFRDSDDPKIDQPLNKNSDIGDTLSLMAARQVDPTVDDKSSPVPRLLALGVHPYTSFLDLRSTDAMAVRCSKEQDPRDANDQKLNCTNMQFPPHSLGPQNAKVDLANKIVVIGDLSDQDMQPFPDAEKERPGVYLQANYIQSILDRRFLQEIPLHVTLIGLVLFIVAISCLHLFLDPKPAFLFSFGALATIVLVSLIVLVKWDYFTPLWALWSAAIVVAVRSLELRAHHLSTEVKEDPLHPLD